MNRDDVLREFGITDVGEITTRYEDMADEIVHLRRNNRALREALRKEQDNALHTSYTLSAEHQRAERVLDGLRDPSDAVLDAMLHAHGGYPFMQSAANVVVLTHEAQRFATTLRAALAAAEQEATDA